MERKVDHNVMLKAVVSYIDKYGWSPSYQDLCDMTGIKSRSCIRTYLEVLGLKGFVRLGDGPRQIMVTDEGRRRAQEA